MTDVSAIDIDNLTRRFSTTEAVAGLNLHVRPGTCYGFFGRNGAGKTTTIRCLLGLLQPSSGAVGVFGLDPWKYGTEVKGRIAYVPDQVAFYPWMTVRETLDYIAAFRKRWNRDAEHALVKQFGLDLHQKAMSLSKGQRTQLALVGAICSEPDLLVLDEPTSGLDPIVRRELIRTVIGAYQDAGPGRTVFVSTHLISEFEGLIDEFTIVERGRDILTMEADTARARYQKISARFNSTAPRIEIAGARVLRHHGREIEIVAEGDAAQVLDRLQAGSPETIERSALTLEEIFVAALQGEGATA